MYLQSEPTNFAEHVYDADEYLKMLFSKAS